MVKRILSTMTGLALIAGIGSSIALSSGTAYASPMEHQEREQRQEQGHARSYTAQLAQLNDSGVTGSAEITFKHKALSISLNAKGLVPNMPHPAHIHGKLTGSDAMCPTIAADTNNDGLISVFEGAPAYGPIKLNLTTPQTAFGAPANTTLFAPFAGTPNIGNFPVSDDSGEISIDQTYTFDMSKQADKDAYAQLKTLDMQHIVVHGGYAPQNVDTPGGSTDIVYDALLPVACGQINISYDHDHTAHMHVRMSKVDGYNHSSSDHSDDNNDN
jgi:hypothetical protein